MPRSAAPRRRARRAPRPGVRALPLALAFVTALSGCASVPGGGNAGAAAAADERAIYRLLIEDQDEGPNGAMLVLADSMTALRNQQIQEALDRNPDLGFSPAEMAAIHDLLEPGRTAPPVPLDLATLRQYEVGDSASNLDARDVLFVSGIGFSPERDRAVVHVDFFCTRCGWGGLTFFRRDAAGTWTLDTRRWMWKS